MEISSYRIPVYRCSLVREKSHPAATKRYEVSNPRAGFELLANYLEDADREHFVVMLLDAKNKIIGLHTMTIGTLTASLVHPREVFKPAILINAHSVILAHNHPSGDPTPSREDREITRRLIDAGNVIGISVLDHIIVGEDTYCSMRERGIVDFQAA